MEKGGRGVVILLSGEESRKERFDKKQMEILMRQTGDGSWEKLRVNLVPVKPQVHIDILV